MNDSFERSKELNATSDWGNGKAAGILLNEELRARNLIPKFNPSVSFVLHKLKKCSQRSVFWSKSCRSKRTQTSPVGTSCSSKCLVVGPLLSCSVRIFATGISVRPKKSVVQKQARDVMKHRHEAQEIWKCDVNQQCYVLRREAPCGPEGKLFPVRQGSSGLCSSFSASRSFLTTQTLISGTTFAYSVVTSSINDSVLSHLKCSVCDIYNLWQETVSRSELSDGTRLHVSCTATKTIKKLSTLAQTTFV